ncbi:MAG: SMC-Scp complex subunit ScpB [Phycisphaeraceae bacterium]|nr:SMC-Scp complex subunit ScpB [Phycisphaeraceae bacterium]
MSVYNTPMGSVPATPSQESSVHETSEPQARTEPSTAEVSGQELALLVEAALLASDRALTSAKLAEAVGATSGAVGKAVEQLNEVYEQTGRSFRIEQVAGGWQVMTLPRFAGVLAALNKSRQQTRLTPAALETLAIIAYKQPVLRAQVEAIRGVASGEVIRWLMDRRLIKIVGRAQELGRPMLYGTTKAFLEVFGLADLEDLPKVGAPPQGGPTGKTQTADESSGSPAGQ